MRDEAAACTARVDPGPRCPIELGGPRLRWRELLAVDADALFALITHPRVAENLPEGNPPSAEAVRAALLARVWAPERTSYSLVLTLDGQIVGTGGLEVTRAQARHRCGEIGYIVHPDR